MDLNIYEEGSGLTITCELCGRVYPHNHYRKVPMEYAGVTQYGRVKRCGCTKKTREEDRQKKFKKLRGHGYSGNASANPVGTAVYNRISYGCFLTGRKRPHNE